MGSSGSVGEAVISRNTAQTIETCQCGLRAPQREGQPSGKCELCARCERRCLCTCVLVYLCTCVLVYLCTCVLVYPLHRLLCASQSAINYAATNAFEPHQFHTMDWPGLYNSCWLPII